MNKQIPEGWRKSSIGEITSTNSLFSDGDWVESKDQDPTGANRLIQLADIGDGIFINKSSRYMNDEQFERLKCTALEKNDILIARMPEPLGRACLYPLEGGKAATVVDVAILRTKNANHYWLMSAINSSDYRHQIDLNASGTTRTRIARGILSNIEILEPPLPEQQKIATILSSVDDVIEKTRAQIDKLKDLKTGMMQELLTKGVGHTEFKDSPVGRIPASWTVGLFEDLCVLQRGFDLPVQDRLKGDVPILGSNGIVGRHNEAKVLSPAVITGRSGSLGDVLFVLEDCWPLNTSLYIKDFKGNDEKFVFYFLQHFNLKKYGTGTGVPTLNRNDVHIVNVSFPCLVEQIKIAEALTVIDETIAKKACSIESKKSLKKALMQDLLTGKVRVKLSNKESAVS